MNLHEYQAKQLFKAYGLPVPEGQVVTSVKEALTAASRLSTATWVAKAQVHAGGRGKAGGVKLVSTPKELEAFVESMLGSRLVTFQTDSDGQPVNSVLVEETCAIERELYLGAVIDRSSQRVVIMASTEGGVDIETVAAETPEKILRFTMDPMLGVSGYQAREMGFNLGLTLEQIHQFTVLVQGLGDMFVNNDLSLLEINPLVVTRSGQLICLDGKVTVDDNAMYRHPKLKA